MLHKCTELIMSSSVPKIHTCCTIWALLPSCLRDLSFSFLSFFFLGGGPENRGALSAVADTADS